MAAGVRPSLSASSSTSRASSHKVMVRRRVLRDSIRALACLRSNLKDPDGRLCCALGLENDQAFKPVDDFQLAIQTRHGQGFLDVGWETTGQFAGRIALEPLQASPELFERQVFQFHIFLFCPIFRFDLLRFLGQKRTNTGARFRTNCVPAF